MEAGPGLSLFQGSDNIQLNAATQGHEEDEEQEDIKRRDKEVRRGSLAPHSLVEDFHDIPCRTVTCDEHTKGFFCGTPRL